MCGMTGTTYIGTAASGLQGRRRNSSWSWFRISPFSLNQDRLERTQQLCLIHKRDGLDAGHLEALAAAQVLAHYQIVAAHHVGAGLGEFGAITLIGPTREVFLLGPHQPRQFVFIGL